MKFSFVLVTFTFTLLSSVTRAASTKDVTWDVTPILGFETVYRSTPTPHTASHLVYGARLTGGLQILSGELEYTNGSDTEKFRVAPEEIKTVDEKAKLGARSIFNLGSLFNMAIRFGGQAKRSTVDTTNGGTVTKEVKPIEYAPYAGAAFGVHLGKMTFSVGTTVAFKDLGDMAKNEYQNVFAVSFGL